MDKFLGAADLARLPIVEIFDLIEYHPDFRAENVVPYRISSSSGMTQSPKTLYQTDDDTRTSTCIRVRSSLWNQEQLVKR